MTCTHPTPAPAVQTSPACGSTSVRSTVVIHNATSPTSEPNAFSIEINDTPSVVQLQVFHEGDPIGESRYDPSYQVIMPNGPECGPTCAVAPWQVLNLAFD